MKIYPTIPQAKFLKLDCKYPLFVAGYGSGKSYALTISAVRDLLLHEEARVAIYSDTYDQLRLNLFPRFQEILLENKCKIEVNKTEYTIKWGKRELIFRSIDNPKRIIGYEVFRSHVDEIEAAGNEIKTEEIWRKIIARNRQNFGIPNRVSVYTTPDQGFGFTYKKWGQSTNPDYQFVKASTRSNPHNPEDYVQSLEADYPPEMVRAFVDGEWCNITSGNVYTSFVRDMCHSDREAARGEPIYVGMDFNINNMAAIVFVQDGRGTTAVDEFVGYTDTPAVISALRERFPNNVITVYPDASGRNGNSSNASQSDITLLRAAGFTIRAPNANPRVRDRIVCVNSRIGDGTVKINTKRCPQLVSCLEKQAYDKNGDPDKSQGYDHANDAFGYRIVYDYPLRVHAKQKVFAK